MPEFLFLPLRGLLPRDNSLRVAPPGRIDIVASRGYINGMITVGIRELKDRLSQYLRMVRRGEEVLVTDRGEVVAELRQPASTPNSAAYPGLVRHARAGRARLGAPNSPALYPRVMPPLPSGSAGRLLDAEREER